MNRSGDVSSGLNMTSPSLNGNSEEVNNEDSNFSSGFVNQALTNACVIVPTVCFVGTVVTVLLGVTFCKMNKACDRCSCLRLFPERLEETDFTGDTSRLDDRTLFATRARPLEGQTDTQNESTTQGLTNPSFFCSDLSRTQHSALERLCLRNFPPGHDAGFDKSPGFNFSDVSEIVNCSDRNALEQSPSSSRIMYNERIGNFLTDSVFIFNKTYNSDAPPGLLNNGTAAPDRYDLGTLDTLSSDMPDTFTAETLNTFGEDSSYSEYQVNPIDMSSSSGDYLHSDKSKLASCDQSSQYTSLSLTSSMQTGEEDSRMYPVHRLSPSEQQAGASTMTSCGSQYTQDSIENVFMRVPPPSPNSGVSVDLAQIDENVAYLNENPWDVPAWMNLRVQDETQASWTTAPWAEECRDQSLEWDNYQPQLGDNNSYDVRTPRTEASGSSASSTDRELFL